jgi:hypothetical protein
VSQVQFNVEVPDHLQHACHRCRVQMEILVMHVQCVNSPYNLRVMDIQEASDWGRVIIHGGAFGVQETFRFCPACWNVVHKAALDFLGNTHRG